MHHGKEVMSGPNNPTLLWRASPGADLPKVPLLNLGGERDHAWHGSHPWTRGCRELVQRGQAVTAASILQ
jgi:hypothetical protein